MIELNLIEDKVIFFKVVDKNNIIIKEKSSSVKRILQEKFKNHNNNSNSFNNKVNDIILKEIDNYCCEDITENNKYNLANIPILNNEKKTRKNTNYCIDTKIIIIPTSIISTLFFSIKLVVYSCSHK